MEIEPRMLCNSKCILSCSYHLLLISPYIAPVPYLLCPGHGYLAPILRAESRGNSCRDLRMNHDFSVEDCLGELEP